MIKKILTILNKKDQKQSFFLFLMLLISTIVETLSITSIPIFVISLTDTDKLFSILSNFFEITFFFENIEQNNLILYISISILFIFLLKNIFISFVNF